MVAAARGPGLRYAATMPWHALWLCALTLMITAISMGSGWLLTALCNRNAGVRVAGMYCVGTRSNAFAWAALAPALDPQGTLFVILMAIPSYLLPVLMKRVVGGMHLAAPVTELQRAPPIAALFNPRAQSHGGA